MKTPAEIKNALKLHCDPKWTCEECPYKPILNGNQPCTVSLMADAVSLIEELEERVAIMTEGDVVPVVRCKDCKYFELNHFEKIDGFPIPMIVSHEICTKWSEGCKTSSEGYCFMGERKDAGE